MSIIDATSEIDYNVDFKEIVELPDDPAYNHSSRNATNYLRKVKAIIPNANLFPEKATSSQNFDSLGLFDSSKWKRKE